MRADRLITILLLLQTRGRMTAGELAGELEVSERTVYRDLEALSMTGIPIYSEHGPGGGYSLLDTHRLNLTGLTQAEVRTLFSSGFHEPLRDLGIGDLLEVALLKISAALPESQQRDADRIRNRIHFDARNWFQTPESVPFLHSIHEAVTHDRRIRIIYQRGDGEVRERIVDPYGLVAKSGIWYVVAAVEDDMRVYRISRIQDMETLDEPFERPEDFDLAAYWTESYRSFETSRLQYPVRLRIAPEILPDLYLLWGDWLQALVDAAATTSADDWPEVTVHFEHQGWAFREIFPFCTKVEIIDPAELRRTVLDSASEILKVYGQDG